MAGKEDVGYFVVCMADTILQEITECFAGTSNGPFQKRGGDQSSEIIANIGPVHDNMLPFPQPQYTLCFYT